jgi:hypothetical protein
MSHRRSLLLCALLLGAATPGLQAAAPITAQAAYDAKDWKTCAVLNGERADRPVPVSGAAYDAACCLALSGDRNGAFARLLKTPTDTLPEVAQFVEDSDLTSLHGDPRWQSLLDRLKRDQAEREARYEQALRKQLAERVAKDQELRQRSIDLKDGKADVNAQIMKTDKDNTAWLKGIVQARGWPTISKVGRDGAQNAWLLAQHADLDPAFQEHVLTLMQVAVAKREASGSNLAYLTDRVRTAQGKPQVYGTQFQQAGDILTPKPIEDLQGLDARRAAVGLGTMAEYVAEGEAVLHKQIQWPPIGSDGRQAPGET